MSISFCSFNDLSNINHDQPEISYDTYNNGFSNSNNTDSNARNLSDINNLTIFIDFQFLEDVSNAVIFEIGSKGDTSDTGGISLYYYLNKLYLNVGRSPNPDNGKGFYHEFNKNFNRNRNIIVLELIKLNDTDINSLSLKLYFNNDIILSEIKNYDNNKKLFSRHKLGFGRSGGSFALHDINIENLLKYNSNNSQTHPAIKGQFRIFENSYQELVRSNYFSNL